MAQQEEMNLLVDVKLEMKAALKNATELKTALEQEKKTLDDLKKAGDITSETYVKQEAAVKLLTQQYAANQRVVAQLSGEVSKHAGAYATLNKEAADAARLAKDMAAAYGVNSKAAQDASAKAKSLSDNLKSIDSSVGQNQRRVGDYAGELGKLGGGFGATVGGAQNLGASLTMLKANPFFAILSVVVTLINAMSTALGSGTESGKKLQQVIAPLNDLMKGFVAIISQLVGAFADGVAAITSYVAGLLDFIPAVKSANDASRESVRIEKEKQALIREGILDKAADAKEELRISELKKKINEADKYSKAERLAFAREVDKAEKALALDDANRANENLKNFLERMKQQGKAQKNYTEDELKQLVDLQAAKYEEQQKYFDNTRKTASKEAALSAQIREEEKAGHEKLLADKEKANEKATAKKKAQQDAEKAAAEAEAKRLKDNADAALTALDNELQMTKLKQEERLAGQKLTDEQMHAQKLADSEAAYQAEQAALKIQLDNKQIMQSEYDAAEKLNYQQKLTDKAVIDAEFKALEEENKAIAAAIDLENEMALAEMKHQSLYDLKVQQLEADRLLELSEAEKTGADKFLIEEKYAEAKKKLNQAEISAKMDMASNFAGNIAEIFGKQTKVGKMAASAQIAIDTAKGAMAAFTSMSSVPFVGPVLGAAAAGAVIAKGVKSIKDVWAVKSGLKGDTGGGGGASVPSGGGGGAVASVTGSVVARQSGSTQQSATTTAMTDAMKAAPQTAVLVTNDVTTALDNKVQLKNDNSL